MGLTWGQLNDSIMELAKQNRIPVTGQFELTPRCNLQCKMCYICRPSNDKVSNEMESSAKEWIQLAMEARDAGMLYLLLTGGEVFIRQDFKTIYEEICMMGFSTEIYTNATMITPKVASWLGRIPPSKVAVTLYGASPSTYQEVCGCADGFDRAVRGIDLLLAEGITVDIRTTIVNKNVSDFTKLAEFAYERKLEFGIVNYVSPRRETGNTNPKAERLTPGELADFELLYENYYKQKGASVPKKEEPYVHMLQQDNINSFVESALHFDEDYPLKCAAGQCSFWITWDGRMTPCGQMNNPFVLPFEIGFAEAWNMLQKHCSNIPLCKECSSCNLKEYCMSCPAMLEAETGAFDKPAPYLCQLAQKRKYIEDMK